MNSNTHHPDCCFTTHGRSSHSAVASNVEDVTCIDGDGSQLLGAIAFKCPKVERISGMALSPAMIKS